MKGNDLVEKIRLGIDETAYRRGVRQLFKWHTRRDRVSVVVRPDTSNRTRKVLSDGTIVEMRK